MPRSLDEGFNTFLGWLAPLASEHNKAASHKGSVESCMKNNFGCYKFFETGSFGNGTGVRHFSDTDYFAVCKTEYLKKSSSHTLTLVKNALQTTFTRTSGIAVDTPAVKIPFGTYASETLEVTPCDFVGMVNTPVGNLPVYEIADGSSEWMKASPQAHTAYVAREDKRLYGKLKPLIQFVKAWKYYNKVPISSFYLELRITKYAEGEKSIIYDIDIKRILKHLLDNEVAYIRDPMGSSGYVKPCKTEAMKSEVLSKLSTGYRRAEKAVSNRENDLNSCFFWWNMFYNDKFPSR